MRQILPDRERIHINVARIKKNGLNFEIVVDPDKAIEYKQGRISNIKDVLANESVFEDAKKGLVASESKIAEIFQTDNTLKVADYILKHGEIQLSAEFRQKLRDDKRKKIIEIIHRNAVDPGTHFPHPSQRIENAMEEAKVKINEYKSAEEQVQDILKQIRIVLPIKFEIQQYEIIIPVKYAVKSFSALKSSASIIKEEWQNDGSLFVVVEIPAGLKDEFFDKLNSMTHGDVRTKLVNTR